MRPVTVDGVPHCASCHGEFLEILDAEVNPDPFHDLPPPPPTRPGAARSPPTSPGLDPGAGGSGFFSSLLGNILGAAAGPSTPGQGQGQEGSYANRGGGSGSPQGSGARSFEFNFPGGGRGQVMFGSFGGNIGRQGAPQMGPFGPVGDNGDPLGSFFPGFNPPRPDGQRLGNPPQAGQPPDGLELLRALLAAVNEEGNAPPGIFFGGPAGRANLGDYATSENGFQDILEQLMQAAGPQGPLPASDIVIEGLPKLKFDEKTLAQSVYKDCPVCKDDFMVGDEVMRIPCAHIFHPDCLKPWLQVNGSCPVCRFSLVPQEPDQAPRPNDNATPSQSTTGAHTRAQGQGQQPAGPADLAEGQSTMTSILNRLFGQSGSASNPTSPGVTEPLHSPFGGLFTADQPSESNTRSEENSTLPSGTTNTDTNTAQTSGQVEDQERIPNSIPEDYRARHRERERQQNQEQHESNNDHTNDYLDLD